jgi:DNA-binding MarR family transcriptional regulator
MKIRANIGGRVSERSSWHFLTNHSHTLLSISDDPDITVRELARRVGITERAVMRIIGELDDAEIIERTREGRRNHYTIHADRQLRHPVESHCTVGDLIGMFRRTLTDAS